MAEFDSFTYMSFLTENDDLQQSFLSTDALAPHFEQPQDQIDSYSHFNYQPLQTFNQPLAPTPSQMLMTPQQQTFTSHSQTPIQTPDVVDLIEPSSMTVIKDSKKLGKKNGNKRFDNPNQKVKAACSNCRSSHVACSHEIPCKRCVEHGIGDSCRYLPRKRRTNFKKRKTHAIKEELIEDDEEFNSPEHQLKEELKNNPPPGVFEEGQSGNYFFRSIHVHVNICIDVDKGYVFFRFRTLECHTNTVIRK